MSQKRVLLLLAPGYEELEAIAVIDILMRGGIEVVVAGLSDGPVPSARSVKIVPDTTLDEVAGEKFDLIVLPGGIDGTENLANDPRVVEMLKSQLEEGRLIGAICAAPTVLERHGLAKGARITCHPVARAAIKEADLQEGAVVEDGLVITGRAAGSAVKFAFKLLERLAGKEKVEEVNKGVLADL